MGCDVNGCDVIRDYECIKKKVPWKMQTIMVEVAVAISTHSGRHAQYRWHFGDKCCVCDLHYDMQYV